ncbi:N(6)-adenine-specific methyltransferase METTL4 isoform X2 [Nelusetta ayraudi]|uniref:N(6)-adenine-specific methyltransferase METTL4 isoform X2 n=1 Tax=Nelusetta ayraudi TaxID=303726 RepID=UPI003F6FCDF6
MSVVVQNSAGWFLDACSFIDQGHSSCMRYSKDGKQSGFKCCFKRQCFRANKSYCSAHASAVTDGGMADVLPNSDKLPKKRKRKQREPNQGEVYSRAFHEKSRNVILKGTQSLVEAARSLGHLSGQTDTVEEPLPAPECGFAALCEMAKELPLVEEEGLCSQPLVAGDGSTSHVDLFSRLTENSSDQALVVTLMGQEYVIPQNSAFLLSDFVRIQPLVQYGRNFDLIVIDPPWENKSVKRSRRYSSLPSTQLKRLPIPLLSSPNCLVVTWVTNRQSHLQFVCDELYPHWGVEVVAQWFWVKVTTSGEYVFPLDSPHKKPYEVLVLGRCADKSTSPLETSQVEDQRVIVSVPSALHSQKPSLSDVLRPYIGAEAKCLELFARNLQPGWTSWGNEVLKFQHTSYFTMMQTGDQGDAEAPENSANNHPQKKTID